MNRVGVRHGIHSRSKACLLSKPGSRHARWLAASAFKSAADVCSHVPPTRRTERPAIPTRWPPSKASSPAAWRIGFNGLDTGGPTPFGHEEPSQREVRAFDY